MRQIMRALSDDECGAETTEVVVGLVILVIAVLIGYTFLRNRMTSQISHAGSCVGVNPTSTVTSC